MAIQLNLNPDRRMLRQFGVLCFAVFGGYGLWLWFGGGNTTGGDRISRGRCRRWCIGHMQASVAASGLRGLDAPRVSHRLGRIASSAGGAVLRGLHATGVAAAFVG